MFCPFFKEECLKEECSAYEFNQNQWSYRGMYYWADKPVEQDVLVKKEHGYCHALRIELPKRKGD